LEFRRVLFRSGIEEPSKRLRTGLAIEPARVLALPTGKRRARPPAGFSNQRPDRCPAIGAAAEASRSTRAYGLTTTAMKTEPTGASTRVIAGVPLTVLALSIMFTPALSAA